ncbi:MAG: hypothetical protein ACI86X_000616 [Moritella sp.]|jgi:hypothetical protein
MAKLKNEKKLFKAAITLGTQYLQQRGSTFTGKDSEDLKAEFIYKALVFDKLMQPLAKDQENTLNIKHKLAIWISRKLPADHPLLKDDE